jgi:hypothetical protein
MIYCLFSAFTGATGEIDLPNPAFSSERAKGAGKSFFAHLFCRQPAGRVA